MQAMFQNIVQYVQYFNACLASLIENVKARRRCLLSTVPNIVKHRQTRRACLHVSMSPCLHVSMSQCWGRDGCDGGENELSRKRSIIQY